MNGVLGSPQAAPGILVPGTAAVGAGLFGTAASATGTTGGFSVADAFAGTSRSLTTSTAVFAVADAFAGTSRSLTTSTAVFGSGIQPFIIVTGSVSSASGSMTAAALLAGLVKPTSKSGLVTSAAQAGILLPV